MEQASAFAHNNRVLGAGVHTKHAAYTVGLASSHSDHAAVKADFQAKQRVAYVPGRYQIEDIYRAHQ